MLTLEERRKQYNIPNDPLLAKNKTLVLNVIAPNRKEPVIHIYIRVSTEKQKQNGQSLDSQLEQVKAYIKKNDIQGRVEEYKEDAVSGREFIGKRPEFARLLSVIDVGDTLIVYSLSRIGRNSREILNFIAEMKSRYIRVICLKEDYDFGSKNGAMLLTFLTAFCEMESDLARERTTDVLRTLREKKELRSRPQFGYKYLKEGKETKIVTDEDQQKLINYILALITANNTISDAEITRCINQELSMGQLKFRKKNKIFQSSVRNIIIANNLRDDTTNVC